MQTKPKRDEFEQAVRIAWWIAWGAWGLMFAAYFVVASFGSPALSRLQLFYWPFALGPLHLTTWAALAARRYIQGKDD